MAVSKDIVRWSSIFVTFTLKKIIDCNSHIHNPACFHLTLDLFQTDSVV